MHFMCSVCYNRWFEPTFHSNAEGSGGYNKIEKDECPFCATGGHYMDKCPVIHPLLSEKIVRIQPYHPNKFTGEFP